MSISVTVILLSSVKLLHGILVKSPKPKKVSYRNDLTAVQSLVLRTLFPLKFTYGPRLVDSETCIVSIE